MSKQPWQLNYKPCLIILLIVVGLSVCLMFRPTTFQVNPTYLPATWLLDTKLSDSVKMQYVIDNFIYELSTKEYSIWNENMIINTTLWHKFTPELLLSILASNISILYDGDSVIRHHIVIVFYILHYYFIEPNNIHRSDAFLSTNNFSTLFYCKKPSKTGVINQPYIKKHYYTYINDLYPYSFHNYSFKIRYRGYLGNQSSMQTYLNQEQTNIIYTDLNTLHGLHLFPIRIEDKFVNVTMFIEKRIDEIVNNAIGHSNVKCLIVRSNNPICADKFEKEYKWMSLWYDVMNNNKNSSYIDSVTDYVSNDTVLVNITEGVNHKHFILRKKDFYASEKFENIVQQCLDYVKHDLDQILYESNVTNIKVTAYDWCKKYVFTSDGTKYVAERIRKYVHMKQTLIGNKLRLLFLDAYKLFNNHCEFTGPMDGRHYDQIKPVELYSFTNIVQKFCM
eukprot:503669_1